MEDYGIERSRFKDLFDAQLRRDLSFWYERCFRGIEDGYFVGVRQIDKQNIELMLAFSGDDITLDERWQIVRDLDEVVSRSGYSMRTKPLEAVAGGVTFINKIDESSVLVAA